MYDMLVNLYKLPEKIVEAEGLDKEGILFKRVLAPDKGNVLQYVINHFHYGIANQCEIAFSNHPISCFIAIKDRKIIGFACYDVIAQNYFGPIGVTEKYRGMGIGKVLTLKCLYAMREDGYGYGIIGGIDNTIEFYKKAVGAILIEDSTPGIFNRMKDVEE